MNEIRNNGTKPVMLYVLVSIAIILGLINLSFTFIVANDVNYVYNHQGKSSLTLIDNPTTEQISGRCSGQYSYAERQDASIFGEYDSLKETLKCCRTIGTHTYCEAPQNIIFRISDGKPEWVIKLN